MAVVLMKTSNDLNYGDTYFGGNPDLPIVCKVTLMVTTVEAQYYANGLISVGKICNKTLLPDDSWLLASVQGYLLWSMYFFSQGPYFNSLADDLDLYLDGDPTPVLVSKCFDSSLVCRFNGEAGTIPARNLRVYWHCNALNLSSNQS